MLRRLKKFSMTQQLVLLFLLVGLTPLSISILATYIEFKHTTEERAIREVTFVGQAKLRAIEDYFISETDTLKDLSTNPRTAEALESFSLAFEKFENVSSNEVWQNSMIKSVEDFYRHQFFSTYQKKSGKKFPVESLMKELDSATLMAQFDFIVNNPNPMGNKDRMNISERDTEYSKIHAKYHPSFRSTMERHAWYDLFLIDAKGRVVYSVFKETDFGSSLTKGPWKQSGLARAFEKSKTIELGSSLIEDYAPYTPSFEAPASFAVSPVHRDGKYLGAVVSQIPLDKISEIAKNRAGLGQNGDVILFGADLKLRADTFRNPKTYSVSSSFAENSQVHLNSDSINRVLNGEVGTVSANSIDGLKTLSFFSPIKIQGLTWYIVTELDESEVFSDLKRLTLFLWFLLISGAAIVTGVAIWFGRAIGKKLRSIAAALEQLSGKVSTAAQLIASSSQQLSSASSEQAASLEETAASLNEISSMVGKSTENAKIMAANSMDSQQKAENGKKVVDLMTLSMAEINTSNEVIMNQIQSSNAKMAEIMKVIQDIGTKTKVINEIVFQTKLLSFNASVEAARAGEHGKGFAVVAEEVGNLAKMSGVAAKEIGEMLNSSIERVEGITTETKSKVEVLMIQGKQKVDSGIDVAHKCADVLNEIITKVSQTSLLAQDVATASFEQSQGVTEINKAIGNLDTATQQNAAVSESSAASAEDLSQQAEELKAVVEQLMETINGISEKSNPIDAESDGAKVLPFRRRESLKAAPVQQFKKAAGEFRIPNHRHSGFEDV